MATMKRRDKQHPTRRLVASSVHAIVRLTPQEKLDLERLARAKGLNISTYIRQAIWGAQA